MNIHQACYKSNAHADVYYITSRSQEVDSHPTTRFLVAPDFQLYIKHSADLIFHFQKQNMETMDKWRKNYILLKEMIAGPGSRDVLIELLRWICFRPQVMQKIYMTSGDGKLLMY